MSSPGAVNLFGAWVAKGGPSTTADGQVAMERVSKDGAQVTQDGHGRYQEAAYRGNMFYAVNTAAQALSVASSTYTGLVLQNPVNNNKNFVLLEAAWHTSTVVTALTAIVLGWGTAQTAGVPLALTTGNSSGPVGTSVLIGSSNRSTAQVGASCTFSVLGAAAAPTILRPLVGLHWITGGAGPIQVGTSLDFGGSLILTPGYNICIEAITTALTGFGYFSWEEIPI